MVTGASYTVLPAKFVKKLGLKVDRVQEFSLADGTVMKRGLGFAIVEVEGKKSPSTVVIGKNGDSPLLGALIQRRLMPMGLMLA